MKVRTRFAPSPTGYLHIGGARTALYSWLFAKKHQGQFILRIEDTDTERSTQEAEQAIFDGMSHLGLLHDEGPFFQMQRLDRYRELSEKLLSEGKAYRCYCSKARLEALRETQMTNKQKPRYDGHCRSLNLPHQDEPYVIRFKNPETGCVTVTDLVRGRVDIENAELDDLVLIRSDGIPTYNFSVVIDDHDMQITHVIRGDDHLNNTPRQINLYQALGFSVPQFAHIPMILGSDGKRLSKRHGAVNVMSYFEEGYLAIALLNYLVRLGWSHGDQEIFSMQEMIDLFDLKQVSRSPASFNPSKLLWLNQHYIKTLPVEALLAPLKHQLDKLAVDLSVGPALEDIILLQKDRAKTLKEMAENSLYFFKTPSVSAELKSSLSAQVLEGVRAFRESLALMTDWEKSAIHDCLKATAESSQLKLGQLAPAIRIAVTGGTVSPSLDATLHLLGRETCLARLDSLLY